MNLEDATFKSGGDVSLCTMSQLHLHRHIENSN